MNSFDYCGAPQLPFLSTAVGGVALVIPTDGPGIRVQGEHQSKNNNLTRHAVRSGTLSRVARVSTVDHPPAADLNDPFEVSRSHLMKMELGKSSSSCKLSLVTRLHRTSMLQEFWCASYEEACVYENLAAHPDVVSFAEQLTRVDFIDEDGDATHTRIDVHVLLRNREEVLVSVKYDEKAKRPSYLAEVQSIAQQASRSVADRLTVLSRFSFHPAYRTCARDIHRARRGWDPDADRIVLDAALGLSETFTFGQLVDRAALGPRGHRAAIRLIGDGDIRKHLVDPFAPDTVCWRAAA